MAIKDDADDQLSTQGMASVRRRWVTRGKSLLEDPGFLRHMAARRRNWDHTHPDYAIGRTEPLPDDMAAGTNIALPPKLLAAWNAAMTEGRHDDARDLADLVFDWTESVLRECDRWWPPHLFPNFAGPPYNPATTIVSCSLVYHLVIGEHEPSEVADRLMSTLTYSPRCHPFDPTNDLHNPKVAHLEARCAALESSLAGLLSSDENRFRVVRDAARTAGVEAERATIRSFGSTDHDARWWYMPLLPGMTTNDWKQLRPAVLAIIKQSHGHNPVHEQVRRMAREGASQERIGFELGITPRRAGQILAGNKFED